MTLRAPSTTRPLPVRLCDIPLSVRAHAAQQAARTADQEERTSLLAAALNPSDTTYYVQAEAEPLLRAWTQRKDAA